MTGPGEQGEQGDRSERERKPPSMNRIVVWIVGVAVGGYLLISGIVGILSHR